MIAPCITLEAPREYLRRSAALDDSAFDRLARLLGARGSRRAAWNGLLGAALVAHHGVGAARNRRGRDGAKRKRNARAQSTKTQGACYNGSPCVRGHGRNVAKCDLAGVAVGHCKSCNFNQANLRGADGTNANFARSNFDGACLVDANLTGANLAGANLNTAIFCRTTMPDGRRNDSGCNRGTTCCPTCALPCPEGQRCCANGTCAACCGDAQCASGVCCRGVCCGDDQVCEDGECAGCVASFCPTDPGTGQPGFCCEGDFCSCGGVCCAGPDCFVVTTQFRNSEITISREYCERPATCVACGGVEERCCTACGPNEECISSGPIIGGSIRRR
jgi:hypothetical protein